MIRNSAKVIPAETNTYICRGDDYMDKANQHTYLSDCQLLTIERHFTGDKSIEEIVKQYVLEQMQNMGKLDILDNVKYNNSRDKTVVTFAEEGSK